VWLEFRTAFRFVQSLATTPDTMPGWILLELFAAAAHRSADLLRCRCPSPPSANYWFSLPTFLVLCQRTATAGAAIVSDFVAFCVDCSQLCYFALLAVDFVGSTLI